MVGNDGRMHRKVIGVEERGVDCNFVRSSQCPNDKLMDCGLRSDPIRMDR